MRTSVGSHNGRAHAGSEVQLGGASAVVIGRPSLLDSGVPASSTYIVGQAASLGGGDLLYVLGGGSFVLRGVCAADGSFSFVDVVVRRRG